MTSANFRLLLWAIASWGVLTTVQSQAVVASDEAVMRALLTFVHRKCCSGQFLATPTTFSKCNESNPFFLFPHCVLNDFCPRDHINSDISGWRSEWTIDGLNDVCAWPGINCVVEGGNHRISGINAGTPKLANLTGVFPNYIANLTRLALLNFQGDTNKLTGTIPESLAALPQLYSVYVDYNMLSGPLPTSWTPAIRYLSLSNNQISGTIPPTLSTLIYGDFANNQFICSDGLPQLIDKMVNNTGYLSVMLQNNFFPIINAKYCGTFEVGYTKYEIAPQFLELTTEAPVFDEYFYFESEAMRVGVNQDQIYFFSMNRSGLFNTNEYIMWRLQGLEEEESVIQRNWYDLFDRYTSGLRTVGNKRFELDARFSTGVLITFDFTIVEAEGYLSAIKVGWKITNYTAVAGPTVSSFKFLLTQYVRLPLEFGAQYECPSPGIDLSSLVDNLIYLTEGLLIGTCQSDYLNITTKIVVIPSAELTAFVEFRYISPDYDIAFLWATTAEYDTTKRSAMDFGGSRTFTNDRQRTSKREYAANLFRPPIRDLSQQWMACSYEVIFNKFDDYLLYDPEIRLQAVFGEFDSKESQLLGVYIALPIVLVIVVAAIVVFAVPKLRKKLFPFWFRKTETITELSSTHTSGSPSWNRASTVDVEIRNAK